MTKRTIFIGDVHGCIDELRELMKKLSITQEDRVIFVGDLINKGPDSVGVVKYIYEHGYESLSGNHEHSYSINYKNSLKYQEYYSYFIGPVHDWIMQLPYFIEGENFIAVHAGLVPDLHPKNTEKSILCQIRRWNPVENKIERSSAYMPWYELYKGRKKVIYGHWAANRLTIRENTIGLDSGCTYGGQLSAYILESNEIVQVQAKKIYQEIN